MFDRLFRYGVFDQAAPLYALGIVALLLLLSRVPLSYNFYNLLTRWKTTALTALAFTLVTGLLVVMLAFVEGMEILTLGSGRPANVIILAEGSTDESFSNLAFSDVGDLENQPGILRDGDRPRLSRETYLIVNQPLKEIAEADLPQSWKTLWGYLPAAKRAKRRFLQIRGIDDPQISAQVHGLQLFDDGRWFSPAGVSEGADAGGDASPKIEVVVGEGIAKQMARDQGLDERTKPRLDVGDTFELNDRTWLITGVMKSEGLTFDSELWAKRSLVGPMFGKETYSALVAETADAAAALRLKNYLNNDYKKSAVNGVLETDYYQGLNETNKQFLVAIQFLTVVMAIGGIFGVMNTMYASINQRTRDIGVLRLLGFNRVQVLTSFLLESIMIAFVGGALGCFLGQFSDGWTANSVVSSGQGGGKFVVLRLVVTAETIAVGMVIALAMGFLGGLLPSLQAIRLRILNALR